MCCVNNIAVPADVWVDGLSTSGAQFDNIDTGEAVLVYSLQRWNGTRTVNVVSGEDARADVSQRPVALVPIPSSCVMWRPSVVCMTTVL